MATKTEAIKAFLDKFTHKDLATLYHHDIECQVNVAHDGGERIEGEYKGRQWHAWTDGLQTWKSFRIPYNANTTPEYTDNVIKFDLALHVEGIGMTGWNWKEKKSMWVAFDFDAISGHSDKHTSKLTPESLREVQEQASKIPWITIRKSTSGKGLHLYVFLNGIETSNHNEHAALARAILGKMASLTGFEFSSRVDVCGGNMWVWHRKMAGTDGLELIKQGTTLLDVPSNWRDHVKVVTGRTRKIVPEFVDKDEDAFSQLVGCRTHVSLDEDHKKLVMWLSDNYCQHWWDSDNHMLVCHTFDLKRAHEALGLQGIFDTEAKGTEHGADHNCYCFPMRKGSWAVRRFTPGVKEAATWEQDGEGWTRCYLNQQPTLATACKHYDGVENDKGGFEFRHASLAQQAALLLGANIDIPSFSEMRGAVLRQHKDGRLIIEMKAEDNDPPDKLKGWLKSKKNSWLQVVNVQISTPTENDVGNYDDLLRHVVDTNNSDAGWVLSTDEQWNHEPLQHIEKALFAMNLQPNEIKTIVGNGVMRPWRLANLPFQPEYPGGRVWNRDAAQLRFAPSIDLDGLKYPTWLKILNHCGQNLTSAIQRNVWAQVNGIRNGADYLKCWIASLFKEPTAPLPYLFFYSSDQNTGKSIFHEALSLLITKGYCRADNALKNDSNFNAELEHAILCVVEETSLKKQTAAYEKIKDWVTSRLLPIHRKLKTPYHVVNTTHWIQCSNDFGACPIFPGDTRITMIHVDPLGIEELIPKKILIPMLEKEAPDFLAAVMSLELPPSNDRLNLPVIETEDKALAMEVNKTPLEQFIDEQCFMVDGECILFSEFYDKFINWLDHNEREYWTKIRMSRSLPSSITQGRSVSNNQKLVANIAWVPATKPSTHKFVNRNDRLILTEITNAGQANKATS